MQASAEPIVAEHAFKLPGEVTKTMIYLPDYIILYDYITLHFT